MIVKKKKRKSYYKKFRINQIKSLRKMKSYCNNKNKHNLSLNNLLIIL